MTSGILGPWKEKKNRDVNDGPTRWLRGGGLLLRVLWPESRPQNRVEKEGTHSYKLSSDGVIGKPYVPQTFTN